jgi:hypothetical protein
MASHDAIGVSLVSPESLVSDADSDSSSSESTDWLTLTQPPWEEEPAGGFAAWAQEEGNTVTIETFAEYFEKYNSQCSEDGHLDVDIQVRKSRADLPYTISASYGALTGPMMENDEISSSVTVEGESSVDLETEVSGTVQASWEGPVYDADNNSIVPVPKISVDGSILSFYLGKELVEVTGTLRLGYTEAYDLYILTIFPRDAGTYDADDDATAYQSTVMAVYNGGIETLEVDLPDMTGNCGGSNLIVDPDDDDDSDQCYDLYVTRHKCTNEIISEELRRVDCPDDTEEDEG